MVFLIKLQKNIFKFSEPHKHVDGLFSVLQFTHGHCNFGLVWLLFCLPFGNRLLDILRTHRWIHQFHFQYEHIKYDFERYWILARYFCDYDCCYDWTLRDWMFGQFVHHLWCFQCELQNFSFLHRNQIDLCFFLEQAIVFGALAIGTWSSTFVFRHSNFDCHIFLHVWTENFAIVVWSITCRVLLLQWVYWNIPWNLKKIKSNFFSLILAFQLYCFLCVYSLYHFLKDMETAQPLLASGMTNPNYSGTTYVKIA